MAGVKKKQYIIVFGILCALISSISIYYLNKEDNPVVKTNDEIIKESVSELTQTDKDALFNTQELKNLSTAYEAKQYDEAIEIAKRVCSTLQDSSVFVCYGVYAQALAKKKDFSELEKLADLMLNNQKVQSDDTLRISWTNIKVSAQKGIDPADAPKMSDEEARQ